MLSTLEHSSELHIVSSLFLLKIYATGCYYVRRVSEKLSEFSWEKVVFKERIFN